VLLGLGRVLLALGMVILPVRFGSGTVGLCCGFVMFRRAVVCIFHVDFSCWSEKMFGDQQEPPQ
jgi:hypothetical protein